MITILWAGQCTLFLGSFPRLVGETEAESSQIIDLSGRDRLSFNERTETTNMKHQDLIAIDIHTHAEVSCWNPFDNYGEEYDLSLIHI